MQSAIRSSQKVRLCSSNRKQNLHAPSTASSLLPLPPSSRNFIRAANSFIPRKHSFASSRSLNFDPFALTSANELFRTRSFAIQFVPMYVFDPEGSPPSINLSRLFRRYREAPLGRIPQNIVEHRAAESPACGRI